MLNKLHLKESRFLGVSKHSILNQKLNVYDSKKRLGKPNHNLMPAFIN